MAKSPVLKPFYLLVNALLILCFFTSCSTSIRQVGRINMISNRNIDKSTNYQLVKSYVGLSKREIKKSRLTTIEESMDHTVKSVPGGEYLMNAKVYLIDGRYFATEGDVWGRKVEEFQGFRIGDMVQWKSMGASKKGVITGLVDDRFCMVKEEGDDSSVTKSYDKIFKVSN